MSQVSFARSNLPSDSRTTAQAVTVDNIEARGIRVTLVVTSLNAVTPVLTVTIAEYDPASQTYLTLLTGAAISTVSSNVYSVHPDLTAAANLVAKDIIRRGRIRVSVAVGDADACTYSLGLAELP